MFDFETELINLLLLVRYLVINKSRGLGITELFLRFMIFLCINADEWRGRRICIVTGSKIDLAYDLIRRLKTIVLAKFPQTKFGKRLDQITLCGVTIEAFPSYNVGSLLGYTDVMMIFVDETERIPKFQQQEARYVIDGYRLKNKPYTIWNSTPKQPDGLLARMQKEYFKLKKEGLNPTYELKILNYKLGVNKIYDEQEIEEEKLKPYFPREYDNKFAGAEGNLFNRLDVYACIDDKYDPSISHAETYKLIGVDQSGGVGLSGISATELRADGIYVLHADDYENMRYNELVDEVFKISKAIGNADFYYADSAYHPFYSLIKQELEEPDDPNYIKDCIARATEGNFPVEKLMRVIPKNFRNRPNMNKQIALGLESRYLHIHPTFEKLITFLTSATGDDKGKLDKEETSYDDVGDSFSMQMEFFDIPLPVRPRKL